MQKLDGVNHDGVSGWGLMLDEHRRPLCVRWHCDYADAIEEPMTAELWDELFRSCEREYPPMPHDHVRGLQYRCAAAVEEWDSALRSLRDTGVFSPPSWLTVAR